MICCKICKQNLASLCRTCLDLTIEQTIQNHNKEVLETLGWLVKNEIQKKIALEVEFEGIDEKDLELSPELQRAREYIERLEKK